MSERVSAGAPLFEVRGPMADPAGPTTLSGVIRLYLSHHTTRLILSSLIPLAMVRVYLGGWNRWDGIIVLVTVVAWPFFEWFFHVLIHLRPLSLAGRPLEPRAAREHRLHHVDPTNIDYTLLPWTTLVGLAVLSIVAFPALLGLHRGLTATVCFHLCGLANGWVHLLTHTRYMPRTRYFRWVRTTHMLHHFKNEAYWYAFSGPFVDVVFGTHRDPRATETSAACAARSRKPPSPESPSEDGSM